VMGGRRPSAPPCNPVLRRLMVWFSTDMDVIFLVVFVLSDGVVFEVKFFSLLRQRSIVLVRIWRFSGGFPTNLLLRRFELGGDRFGLW
jgi:hypothetical protein